MRLSEMPPFLIAPVERAPPQSVCAGIAARDRKLGRKEPAIPFNVSPMAPHSGRIKVNYPPSPLWMFLSRAVDWIAELRRGSR
jgi:hypothetical protein